jgi:NACalpha-BTF3-like transcription factor
LSLPIAEEIIKRAEANQDVSAKERRHAIAFVMAMQPENAGTTDLSKLFKVSDRQIRLDKQEVREERSKLISEEDIGLVIADIRMSHENAARELYRQAKFSKQGSQVRLNYITAQHNILLKTVEALSNLGYYPKNLGTQTVNRYEYIATVDMKSGDVEVHNRNALTDEQFAALEANQTIAEPEYLRLPADTEEDFSGLRESIPDAEQ